MVMLEDYGVSDEKGYADLKQLNKAIGMYIFTPRNCILCVIVCQAQLVLENACKYILSVHVGRIIRTYVTGPTKIDHVSANYTQLYFH